MRNLLFTTTLLAMPSLGAATVEPPPNFHWAQVQLAYLSQQNSACMKDSTGFGLGAGQWFKPRWGWEATYVHSQLEPTTRLWKASEDHFDATALHRPFLNTGRWVPFLRAGAGLSRLANPLSLSGGATTRLNLVGAVGTQFILGPRSLGSLELRSTTVETSTRRHEFAALVGFGLRWGSPAAPIPVPVPVAAPAPAPAPAAAPVPAPVPAPIPPPSAPAAPEPVAVPVPLPAPAPAPLPTKIVLGDAVLHFANNGADLSPEGRGAVQAVAQQLKAYPGGYTLMVSGHTSSLGKAAHNHALSKRRAQAVAKLLIGAGIPADRVFTVGRGPEVPIGDNKTKDGQSQNRRVEIDIQTTETVVKTRQRTGLVDVQAPTKAPAKALKARPKARN